MTRRNCTISGLFLLLVLTIVTAGCTGVSSPSPVSGTQNLTLEDAGELVRGLTGKNFTASSLESVPATGDLEGVQQYVDRFWQEHPETRPDPSGISLDGIATVVTNLTASREELSAVQAALDRGDPDTAHTLLERFVQEHPEAQLGSDIAELWSAEFNLSTARTLGSDDAGATPGPATR